MTRLPIETVLFAAVLALATPALAEDPANPALQTATKHASLAVGAKALPDVKMHLHHVLNCLEGPKGQDYDAKHGDPCGAKGAVDALPAGSADRARAQKAIDLARQGANAQDFKPAHESAQAVQAVLAETAAPAKVGAGAR